jgi:putative flippase GtrA
MLKKLLDNEKIRFLAIGGINTVVGYLLFALFYWLLGTELYLAAYIASYVVALFSGYTLQRLVVFRVKGHLVLDFLRYTTVQLGAFVVNIILLPLFVEVFKIDPLISQAIILFITVVSSYFAHRYFSFRRKEVILEEETP